jgi:hypothetical protein
MNFAQVIGQYYTKESLIQSVQKGRIPHAQLFLGKTGLGWFTTGPSLRKIHQLPKSDGNGLLW